MERSRVCFPISGGINELGGVYQGIRLVLFGRPKKQKPETRVKANSEQQKNAHLLDSDTLRLVYLNSSCVRRSKRPVPGELSSSPLILGTG